MEETPRKYRKHKKTKVLSMRHFLHDKLKPITDPETGVDRYPVHIIFFFNGRSTTRKSRTMDHLSHAELEAMQEDNHRLIERDRVFFRSAADTLISTRKKDFTAVDIGNLYDYYATPIMHALNSVLKMQIGEFLFKKKDLWPILSEWDWQKSANDLIDFCLSQIKSSEIEEDYFGLLENENFVHLVEASLILSNTEHIKVYFELLNSLRDRYIKDHIYQSIGHTPPMAELNHILSTNNLTFWDWKFGKLQTEMSYHSSRYLTMGTISKIGIIEASYFPEVDENSAVDSVKDGFQQPDFNSQSNDELVEMLKKFERLYLKKVVVARSNRDLLRFEECPSPIRKMGEYWRTRCELASHQ